MGAESGSEGRTFKRIVSWIVTINEGVSPISQTGNMGLTPFFVPASPYKDTIIFSEC